MRLESDGDVAVHGVTHQRLREDCCSLHKDRASPEIAVGCGGQDISVRCLTSEVEIGTGDRGAASFWLLRQRAAL